MITNILDNCNSQFLNLPLDNNQYAQSLRLVQQNMRQSILHKFRITQQPQILLTLQCAVNTMVGVIAVKEGIITKLKASEPDAKPVYVFGKKHMDRVLQASQACAYSVPMALSFVERQARRFWDGAFCNPRPIRRVVKFLGEMGLFSASKIKATEIPDYNWKTGKGWNQHNFGEVDLYGLLLLYEVLEQLWEEYGDGFEALPTHKGNTCRVLFNEAFKGILVYNRVNESVDEGMGLLTDDGTAIANYQDRFSNATHSLLQALGLVSAPCFDEATEIEQGYQVEPYEPTEATVEPIAIDDELDLDNSEFVVEVSNAEPYIDDYASLCVSASVKFDKPISSVLLSEFFEEVKHVKTFCEKGKFYFNYLLKTEKDRFEDFLFYLQQKLRSTIVVI